MKGLLHQLFSIVWGTCFLLISFNAFSQDKDTTKTTPKRQRFLHNIFQQARKAVTVSKKDSANRAVLINTRSEIPFQLHHGKIIRNIITSEFGFEKTFTDTTRRIAYFGTRILNSLHTDTRPWVIRNNLFIKSNTELNAYLLGDNERYLRSLDFIQDARIIVRPIPGIADSIDIEVITKDLFSITAGLDVKGIQRVRVKVGDNNLLGMGQRLQFTSLVDTRRQPGFGYEVLYTKKSIGHTFTDASVGYTLINTGRSNGSEEEKALFVRLDRPLVSPYSHLAGGVEVSYNHSENFYRKPDSQFYSYRYNLYDLWGGYNLGVTKLLNSKTMIRDRSFIALRYLRNHFVKKPFQITGFDALYNSRQAVLGEFTLFRQDFYKTNYIYGFGTTEDVPYGFNIAFTGGWYQQLHLERLYTGVNANYFVATKKGEFMQFFFRSGNFFSKKKSEDANIMLGTNLYSRLFVYRNLKFREYIRFSFTKQFNRVTLEPLRIDNPYGLQSFRSDSALGKQRISLYAETFAFIKYKLFGFQLAPFVFADLSMLTPEENKFSKSDIYTGIGGGIRTRNENLVFGTIELRMFYFPNTAERNTPFKISFRSNIRFRYTSRYIRPPDIIQLNVGDNFPY
ncbi:MAG: hypothetical protein WKF89_06475 [Chitinophagaceae bacterium]